MNSALQVDRELPPALTVLGAGSEGTLTPREGPFPASLLLSVIPARVPPIGQHGWASRVLLTVRKQCPQEVPLLTRWSW